MLSGQDKSFRFSALYLFVIATQSSWKCHTISMMRRYGCFMQENDYIPPDLRLPALLDDAYVQTMRTLEQNLRMMKRVEKQSRTLREGQRLVLTDQNDQIIDFENPQIVRYYRRETRLMWREFQRDLQGAMTAQEQMGSLLHLLRESFTRSAYNGNNRALPRFFDEVVNRAATHYEDNETHEKLAEAEAADNVERIARSQRSYMQESLGDFCNYSNLCLDALADIELLTEQYEARHLPVGETRAKTPYDVLFRRYYRARQQDPENFSSIEEQDKREFIDDAVNFYRKELFGPFSDLIVKGKPCLELAWFIGAAIDAVRIEECEQLLEKGEKFARLVEKQKHGPLRVRRPCNDADIDKLPGFVESLEPTRLLRRPNGAIVRIGNDYGRTDFEILNDDAACARIHEILEDILNDYPDMLTSIEELVAAKSYMHAFYLGEEEEQHTGVVR